jgi:hypothetical protein
MSPSKYHSDFVLAHHRKNGKVEVRYAAEFIKRPKTPKTPPLPHLHFRRSDRSQVCKCSDSKRHRFSFPVAKYSTHLEADLLRYLDRQCINACSLVDFHAYQKQQRDYWARAGIFVEDFHYATKQKDVVCGCTKSNNHGRGAVRNTEVVELCAEFFRANKGRMTCTKTQWRGASLLLHEGGLTNLTGRRGSRGEKRVVNAFKYDSQSTVDLLRATANLDLGDPLPSPKTDMTHLRSGQNGVPDIPEQVWIKARPSVYNDRRGSETSVSTPIGIIIPPQYTAVEVTPTAQSPRPESSRDARRSLVATVWSTAQHETAAGKLEVAVECEELLTPTRTDSFVEPLGISLLHEVMHDGRRSFRCWSQQSLFPTTSSVYSRSPGLIHYPSESQPPPSTRAHELPAKQISSETLTSPFEAELHGDSTPELDSHAFTLRELEGSPSKPASNWQGKQSRISIEASSLHSQIYTKNSVRLSTMFRTVHDAVGLSNQEEFLLRHVQVCSRRNLPPFDKCSVCKEQYDDRRKRIIGILSCGHFMHEQCLIKEFRVRDDSIGRCPVCNLALCERNLAECIETDRKAVFGSQFSRLHNEERIEFPHRREVACLQSEEEFAAAKLRLVKDYIDVHAEDLWHQWQTNGEGPNWYAGVIQPVVSLFKGWGSPLQQSRYFTSQDAFLKLVSWAELVRLMNVMHAAISKSRGSIALFLPLAELHRKFLCAKARYDKEKQTWKTGRRGVLDCDKVAKDVCDLAMSTHPEAC